MENINAYRKSCTSDLWCDSCVVVHHSYSSFLCAQLKKSLEKYTMFNF